MVTFHIQAGRNMWTSWYHHLPYYIFFNIPVKNMFCRKVPIQTYPACRELQTARIHHCSYTVHVYDSRIITLRWILIVLLAWTSYNEMLYNEISYSEAHVWALILAATLYIVFMSHCTKIVLLDRIILSVDCWLASCCVNWPFPN